MNKMKYPNEEATPWSIYVEIQVDSFLYKFIYF